MSENRRSFLRRGVQVLAVALPAVVVMTAAPKSAEAAKLRDRVKGLFSRKRGCSTC